MSAITYVPCSPRGNVLLHLEAPTENEAWTKLLAESIRVGAAYRTTDELKNRGWTVVDLEST